MQAIGEDRSQRLDMIPVGLPPTGLSRGAGAADRGRPAERAEVAHVLVAKYADHTSLYLFIARNGISSCPMRMTGSDRALRPARQVLRLNQGYTTRIADGRQLPLAP
jgi:hypothetical protein